MKTTRSERQAGRPIAPVQLQRKRILQALVEYRGSLRMSSMAKAAFPDYQFRSPQGAALAVSRTVRGMHDDKLLFATTYGYEVTALGRKQAASDQIAAAILPSPANNPDHEETDERSS